MPLDKTKSGMPLTRPATGMPITKPPTTRRPVDIPTPGK